MTNTCGRYRDCETCGGVGYGVVKKGGRTGDRFDCPNCTNGKQCAGGEAVDCGECSGHGEWSCDEDGHDYPCQFCNGTGKWCPTCHKPIPQEVK